MKSRNHKLKSKLLEIIGSKFADNKRLLPHILQLNYRVQYQRLGIQVMPRNIVPNQINFYVFDKFSKSGSYYVVIKLPKFLKDQRCSVQFIVTC